MKKAALCINHKAADILKMFKRYNYFVSPL